MDEEKTKVIFRVWPQGDVIALFPEIPHDRAGHMCESYQHIGQHGGADYPGVIRVTRPAKPAEYADLAHELSGIGYNLEIRKRFMRRRTNR